MSIALIAGVPAPSYESLSLIIGKRREEADSTNSRYPDEAALESHREQDHYKAAIKKGGDEGLLAGPMTVYKLQALSGGFDSR